MSPTKTPAPSEEPTSSPIEKPLYNDYEKNYQHGLKEIATQYTDSIVKIQIYDNNHNILGSGSGFVVTDDGKVVTNYHVVAAAADYTVLSDCQLNFENNLNKVDKERIQSLKNKVNSLNLSALSKNLAMVMNVTIGSNDANTYSPTSTTCLKETECTEYNVIKNISNLEILASNNKTYPVISIVAADKSNDLAILKFDNNDKLPCVKLGDSDKVSVGQSVVTMGYPLGFSNTIAGGGNISTQKPVDIVFQKLDRNFNLYTKTVKACFQTNAAISPGSSGGALINMNGEVIGVTFAGLNDGQNMNFAIPINRVKALLEKKIEPINFKNFETLLKNKYGKFSFERWSFTFDSITIKQNELNSNSLVVTIGVNRSNFEKLFKAKFLYGLHDGKKGLFGGYNYDKETDSLTLKESVLDDKISQILNSVSMKYEMPIVGTLTYTDSINPKSVLYIHSFYESLMSLLTGQSPNQNNQTYFDAAQFVNEYGKNIIDWSSLFWYNNFFNSYYSSSSDIDQDYQSVATSVYSIKDSDKFTKILKNSYSNFDLNGTKFTVDQITIEQDAKVPDKLIISIDVNDKNFEKLFLAKYFYGIDSLEGKYESLQSNAFGAFSHSIKESVYNNSEFENWFVSMGNDILEKYIDSFTKIEARISFTGTVGYDSILRFNNKSFGVQAIKFNIASLNNDNTENSVKINWNNKCLDLFPYLYKEDLIGTLK